MSQGTYWKYVTVHAVPEFRSGSIYIYIFEEQCIAVRGYWEYEILIHTYQLAMVCLDEVVAAGSGCSSFVHGLLLVLLNKRKPNGLFIE